MSLLYAYLLSTKKIALPSGTDKMYTEDSHEIENVLSEMFQLMKKEKGFICEVYNSTIEAIQDKEATDKIEADEKSRLKQIREKN